MLLVLLLLLWLPAAARSELSLYLGQLDQLANRSQTGLDLSVPHTIKSGDRFQVALEAYQNGERGQGWVSSSVLQSEIDSCRKGEAIMGEVMKRLRLMTPPKQALRYHKLLLERQQANIQVAEGGRALLGVSLVLARAVEQKKKVDGTKIEADALAAATRMEKGVAGYKEREEEIAELGGKLRKLAGD